jgi:hypothetical protein
MTTEDELISQIAALQKRIDDHDAQLRKLFQLNGPASWQQHQRQERQNAELRAHESHLASGVGNSETATL